MCKGRVPRKILWEIRNSLSPGASVTIALGTAATQMIRWQLGQRVKTIAKKPEAEP